YRVQDNDGSAGSGTGIVGVVEPTPGGIVEPQVERIAELRGRTPATRRPPKVGPVRRGGRSRKAQGGLTGGAENRFPLRLLAWHRSPVRIVCCPPSSARDMHTGVRGACAGPPFLRHSPGERSDHGNQPKKAPGVVNIADTLCCAASRKSDGKRKRMITPAAASDTAKRRGPGTCSRPAFSSLTGRMYITTTDRKSVV